jgi:hypothetical protein
LPKRSRSIRRLTGRVTDSRKRARSSPQIHADVSNFNRSDCAIPSFTEMRARARCVAVNGPLFTAVRCLLCKTHNSWCREARQRRGDESGSTSRLHNAGMRMCRRPLSGGCHESRGRVRRGKRQFLCGAWASPEPHRDGGPRVGRATRPGDEPDGLTHTDKKTLPGWRFLSPPTLRPLDPVPPAPQSRVTEAHPPLRPACTPLL